LLPGLSRVKVYENLKCGPADREEVIAAGKKLKPGQLYDINSQYDCCVSQYHGGTPVKINIAVIKRRAAGRHQRSAEKRYYLLPEDIRR